MQGCLLDDEPDVVYPASIYNFIKKGWGRAFLIEVIEPIIYLEHTNHNFVLVLGDN